MRDYQTHVFLDGEQKGYLVNGDNLTLETEPGRHVLELKNDLYNGTILDATLEEDGTAVLEVQWSPGSWTHELRTRVVSGNFSLREPEPATMKLPPKEALWVLVGTGLLILFLAIVFLFRLS